MVKTGSNHPIEIVVEGDDSNVTLYASSAGIGLWDNTTSSAIGSVDWQ